MYLNNENLAYIAKSDKEIYLIPKMANRHGLIAGATGTGKTITLKVLAETFSDMGTPVFLADVKGDLTSMIKALFLFLFFFQYISFLLFNQPPHLPRPAP